MKWILLASVIGCGLLAALAAGDARAQPLAQRIEFGAGMAFPFESDNRTIYGVAPTFNLGYAARFGQHAWFALETGLLTSGGMLLPDDPTFETDVRYWMMPFTFGVRGSPSTAEQRVQFYLGIAFESAVIWQENLKGDTTSSTVSGIAIDLRPEIPLGGPWTLWVRQRFALLSGSSNNNDVNQTGAHTQIGLSFGGS